jgi:hypothetical protein
MTSRARETVFGSFLQEYVQFGVIRLRRFDDLLGGEIEEFERQQRESARLMLQVSEMARAIGEHPESGMNADEAFVLLSSPEADTALKISVAMKWGPPGGFGSVAAMMPAKEEMNTRMITLVLRSRGSVMVDEVWQSLEDDWSDEDSRALPGRIRTGVIEFLGTESKGGPEKGKPQEAQAEPKAKVSTSK